MPSTTQGRPLDGHESSQLDWSDSKLPLLNTTGWLHGMMNMFMICGGCTVQLFWCAGDTVLPKHGVHRPGHVVHQ